MRNFPLPDALGLNIFITITILANIGLLVMAIILL